MTQPRKHILVFLLGLASACLLLVAPAAAQTQSNAADLQGVVSDPTGARVPGATVTVRNLATNLERSTTSDAAGVYRVLALPPGRYEVVVDAPGFTTVRNPGLELLIGSVANYDVHLDVRAGQETVVVTTEAALIETQRTAVAETITSRAIQNLPINQRDYLNFTLLTSNAARDSAPSIGAAPTSGLNFGGQRARSNQVSLDGADATDNSVNGVRSTVSQEAVQEFQIITNSYMAEFGRASGAIVNIVTKGGSNDVHGNVFGFLRNKRFQARNPFSTVDDPAFTRVQAGFTIGGPLKRDRSFYFFSFETRRRQETGFSSIGEGNFGFISVPTSFGPQLLTPDQRDFLFGLTDPTLASTVGAALTILGGGGAATAIDGTNVFSGPFFLTCPGAPAPPCLPVEGLPGELQHFVPLSQLIGNYPVSEGTSFWSARLDHHFNQNHIGFVRVSVTPSTVDGIQVNAQNQTFGQNAASRTSVQEFRDQTVVSQLTSTLGSAFVNQFRFQFARRSLSYRFAEFPGGDQVAVNIGGFAFFGREPFSSIDRIEKRWQFTDNLTWIKGRHTFKTGVDVNIIDIAPRGGNQIFQLNFGGLYNFGALPSESFVSSLLQSTFGLPPATADALIAGAQATSPTGRLPALNAVQTYGLGIPQIFIQGLGDSNSPFTLKTFAWFVQDSWRVRSNLTLNYGIRYDIELTPIFRPGGPSVNDAGSQLIGQAEQFLGVVEGLRRDQNNVAPRIGLAWDPWDDNKTVIRAAYGLFFDHPLLALAFNSNTADGSQSVQQFVPFGLPDTGFSAASLFQGILTAPPSFGYSPTEGRFDPFLSNSTFINLNFCPQPSPNSTFVCGGGPAPLPILPWTLPTEAGFEFAYAQQANLTIERELVGDFALSVGYNYVHGLHLNRPRNINATDPDLLGFNFLAASAAGLDPSDPRFFALPLASTPTFNVVVPGIFGFVTAPGPFLGAPVGQPFAFNYFRPTGPNLAFTGPLGIADASVDGLIALGNTALAGIGSPLRYPAGPGFFVPFSDVIQQESSGASIYHGLTVNLRKRYRNHYQFLASYTWSHAIDDSTDLQTLLSPQDNSRPDLERGNSTFDLRHRFVFSAVFESPFSRNDAGAWRKVFADFVIAPIFEVSTGRPFTVLSGSDFNLDFGSNTDRPSVVQAGTPGAVSSPDLPVLAFLPPTVCPSNTTASNKFFGCTGTLGRNTFTRPKTWNLDLRVSRKIHFNERLNLELIADMFNLFNRFNVADVNPLCDPIAGRCIAGQPTAALDARQFEFGVKLSW